MRKNAIILCSGGIDSVTTSYYVKKKLGYEKLIVLFFNYNQRTVEEERGCSQKCALSLGSEFKEIKLDELGKLSTSLINSGEDAEKVSREDLKDSSHEGEKFYVPCRNSVFLVYALALGESLFIKEKEVYDIFVGFKCEGEESYPDTTKEFVEQMNELSGIGCSRKFSIKAPLIEKDKEDIIRLGEKLEMNFSDTFTCYIGSNGKHCGTCLSCRLRQEGFYWADIKDPTSYAEKMSDFRLAKG